MQIKLDDHYYITSDSYNPAALVKTGINSKTGKPTIIKHWYCGRKLSTAIDEYIKQTANDSDEITTIKGYAALVDKTEQRIARLLKEGEIG